MSAGLFCDLVEVPGDGGVRWEVADVEGVVAGGADVVVEDRGDAARRR